MHPVLFEIFGLKIHGFGVMVTLAFLAGFALMLVRARRAGDNVDDYMEAPLWLILAGIGGARLFYFLWYPRAFLADPVGALLSSGGLVWYGGVAGVVAAAWIFTRVKKIALPHFSDILAPCAALGLAIGRIGCLLAGCCYGAPCDLPWAIRYPHAHETHGLPVHPAPLYETFLMLLVMGILLRLDRNKPYAGFTTAWFFILAGLVRFGLEYIRGDRLLWDFPLVQTLNLSASQFISLLIVAIGATMLVLLKSKNLPLPGKTEDLAV